VSNSQSGAQSEADLIQTLFAPLALGAMGSFDLKDDVAFLPPATHGLIVTQDQIIEGTHFLAEDPLDMIARRLVRRNLSDMIAKGGKPKAAFLSLAWPKSRKRAGMAEFARGLGDDLANLCGMCPLMGGDTSETSGHLIASLTMMGTPTAASGQPVLRNGAQVGDVVAVTGVIGDSWLGLQARQGTLSRVLLKNCATFSLAPCPPDVAMADLIGRYAHAAIDISDGLILDASYIAKASGVAITLHLDKVPLSEEAGCFQGFDSDIERAIILSIGGDDYQPLIAINASDFEAYKSQAEAIGVRVTRIGTCAHGAGVHLEYDGAPVEMPSAVGWQI
jgi:thiamine-monophosphate kinase